MGIQKPYSEETGKLIDEEVRQLVANAYEHSKEILESNKESLRKVAELLLEKEVIYKEDMEQILGRRNPETVATDTTFQKIISSPGRVVN